MSPNAELTQRETYSFLEYLGDIGGLVDLLRYFFIFLVYVFNHNRVNAILTNRLYHLNKNKNLRESHEAIKKMGKYSDKIKPSSRGRHEEIELAVPFYLDW